MTSRKEPEYITMSVLKQVMDTQEKAFKSAITILIEDVKSEVKDIRKEIEELKLSVKFMSRKYDDVKKKVVKADNEINGVYAQIKSINKEMKDGFEDLEWKQEYFNQSNAWDAWRWRKSMWLAIHDGAITLGVSLHKDMTKLMLYQSEAGRCSWNTDC